MSFVPADATDNAAMGGFDAFLQREVEKVVWTLEAARLEPAYAEVCMGQVRRILDGIARDATAEDQPLVLALCESACRLIDGSEPGPAQQRSLREHVKPLRNIVIANLQNRRYGTAGMRQPSRHEIA